MPSAAKVYDALPHALRSAAISVYGWRLARLRYGGSYRRRLQQLLDSQYADSQTLRQLQQNQLTELLRFVTTHSEYYQAAKLHVEATTLDSLSEHMPILEKSTLRHQQTRIEVRSAGSIRVNTSGTTGTPVNLLASKDGIRANYAFFGRFLRWGGVDVRDRSATFSGRTLLRAEQTEPPFWLYNRATNTMHYSSYHLSSETVAKYLASLEKLRPKYIDSYPSAIFSLAQAKNRASKQYRVQPDAIFTSSETLLAHQREEIEEAFGCKVFDQYGSAEMAGFIAQCEAGSYHVNPEYGIVEIVGEDGMHVSPGQTGRLILTGFVNRATPLVRYEIGDLAVASDAECSCGRAFATVTEITGRLDDTLITPDGRRIGRLDPVFKGTSGIREAQIIQDAIDQVTVLLVPDTRGSKMASARDQLKMELIKRLGTRMRIDIQMVEDIPRTASGKFRAVISRLDRQIEERGHEHAT